MFLVRTSLRPSAIHGIGVFTDEPIQKGQLVWEFDERIDLRIPLDEMKNFPPAMQEFLFHLSYVELVDGRKMMTLCADNAKYVNHADLPNLLDSEDNLREIAARDIAAGEELTCNYHVSDLLSVDKIGSPMAVVESIDRLADLERE